MKTFKTAFEECFDFASEDDLVAMHNIYCEENNYPDDTVFNNDEEFIETSYGENVIKLWRDISNNSFYTDQDDYVCYNGQGNLESFSTFEDSCVDFGISCYSAFFEENAHKLKGISGFEDVCDWEEGQILLEEKDKVYWNDPAEETSGEYWIAEDVYIGGEDDEDTVILITNGVSEVEVTANELDLNYKQL